MKKIKITNITLCALFTALSAAFSQIAIPLPPVPINLTHVSIFCAAGLLGTKSGTLSQIIFVLLGAVGIPVFSGFNGGISHIAGATGGFIIGYILCAFLTGYMIDFFGKNKIYILISAMSAGMILTYICGITWFMYVTENNFKASLLVFINFLPGDAVKIILSSIIVKRLSPVLNKLCHR